jgi:high-affinity iron transporter
MRCLLLAVTRGTLELSVETQCQLAETTQMLSALLVALREGVEAALVVGIVLVYLSRTGRRALARYVWAGVAVAVACSFAAAVLLQRWQVSEDGFEGLLMLLAAVLVVSMIIWMNRVARRLRSNIEQ